MNSETAQNMSAIGSLLVLLGIYVEAVLALLRWSGRRPPISHDAIWAIGWGLLALGSSLLFIAAGFFTEWPGWRRE